MRTILHNAWSFCLVTTAVLVATWCLHGCAGVQQRDVVQALKTVIQKEREVVPSSDPNVIQARIAVDNALAALASSVQ